MAEDKTTLVIACRAEGTAQVSQFGDAVRNADISARQLLGTTAQLFAGSKIAQFGKSTIETFSQFQESSNRFRQTFMQNVNVAEQYAKTLQKRFGESVISAQNMLEMTGGVMVGFGYAEEKALDLAFAVSKAGADIASYKDLTGGATQSTYAITRAMLGETEALKQLGIAVRLDDPEFEKRVRMMQYQEGLTYQQARAQMVLNEVLRQSARMSGDFERTQGNIANQGRILNNALQETRTNLGRGLAPAFQSAQRGAIELLGAFNDLTPGQQDFISKTAAITSVLAGLKVAANLAALSQSLLNKAKAESVVVTETETASVLRNSTAVIGGAAASKAAMQSAIQRNVASIAGQKSAIMDLSAKIQDAFSSGKSGKAINNLVSQYNKAGESLKNLFNQRSVLVAQAKTAENFNNITASAGRFGVTVNSANKILQKTSELSYLNGKAGVAAFSGIGKAALSAGSAIKGVGTSLKALAAQLWPLLAIGMAISGIDYLIHKNENKFQSNVDISDKDFQAQKTLIEKNNQIRSQDEKRLERLAQLSRYGKLNNSETEEAVQLNSALSEKYGNLGISIDKTSGKVFVLSGAFKNLSQVQKAMQTEELQAGLVRASQRAEATVSNLRYTLGSFWGEYSNEKFDIGAEFLLSLPREQRLNELMAVRAKYSKERDFSRVEEIDKAINAINDEIEAEKELYGFTSGNNATEQAQTAAMNEDLRKAKESYFGRAWQLKFDISNPEQQLSMLDEKLKETYLAMEENARSSASPLLSDKEKLDLQSQYYQMSKDALDLELQRLNVSSAYTEEQMNAIKKQKDDQMQLLDLQVQMINNANRFRQTASDAISANSVEAIRITSRMMVSGGMESLQKSIAESNKSIQSLNQQQNEMMRRMEQKQNDIYSWLSQIKAGGV